MEALRRFEVDALGLWAGIYVRSAAEGDGGGILRAESAGGAAAWGPVEKGNDGIAARQRLGEGRR